MIFFKLDYVIEKEQAWRREAAQCAAHASRAVSARPETFRSKLRRLAKELVTNYLTHQSWKAQEGAFISTLSASGRAAEGVSAKRPESQKRALRKLAGVKLSASEADVAWPRVLDHKWFLSERLGRDVGLRVAAVDYFENIQPPRRLVSVRGGWGLPPRLPMMMPFGERLSL